MKKIVSLLFTFVFAMSFTLTAFAYTPTYTSPDIPKVPEINASDITLPEGVKDAVDKKVKDDVENIKLLNTPTITENRYIHGRVFWDKSRLQVRWDEVDEATSYEIKVTKSDGAEKTYTSSYTSLIVNKNEDDFITDCVMGGSVKIRAVKDDSAVYSLWTDEETIGCNKVFH